MSLDALGGMVAVAFAFYLLKILIFGFFAAALVILLARESGRGGRP